MFRFLGFPPRGHDLRRPARSGRGRRETDSIYAASVASTRGEVKEAFQTVVDPQPPPPVDDKSEKDDDNAKAARSDKDKPRRKKAGKDDKTAPPVPVELSLNDACLRLQRVTQLPGNESDLEMTPGGERYIFSATIGERGLFSIKWDGSDRKKLADNVSVQGVTRASRCCG